MGIDAAKSEQSPKIESKTLAPTLLEYTQNVLDSVELNLRNLAKQAIGTHFNPENADPVVALASNSFREQLAYQRSKDPTIVGRFAKFGIGVVIDSNKQQDVNILTNGQFGDSYILKNMESIMTFAKEENLDVMIGRYSGDEILTFFIPHKERSAEELMKKFTAWNRKFLSQKDPINDELRSLIPDLQKIHGLDIEVGASIKAINLKDVTFSKKKNIRERQLLGDVIDAIEHKIRHGKDNLSHELLANMMESRKLTYSYKEIPWFPTLLPDSVLNLFEEAKMQGADPAEAGAYAEDATFESLYPRMRVYRMEVFEEMAKKFTAQDREIVLVKSADPYMKWTNKYVSHSTGDQRMLGLADMFFTRIAYLATFQHHGSLLHILPAEHLDIHNRTVEQIVAEQDEPVLDVTKDNPGAFRVITSGIIDADGSTIIPTITKDTSSQELWNYVDMLRTQQTINEITTLITRVGAHIWAITNLIEYLSVRMNRLEQAINVWKNLKPKAMKKTQGKVEAIFTYLRQKQSSEPDQPN